jgi:hypothetical protein
METAVNERISNAAEIIVLCMVHLGAVCELHLTGPAWTWRSAGK